MVEPELLARCRRGDPAAFEEVVRRTYRHVYTQALRLVGDRHDAEDVAQDAYLRVFRGLAGFREEARFETWLFRIVANAALSFLRRRGRFGELLTEPEEGPREEPPNPRDREVPGVGDVLAERDLLVRALEALPPSLRTVVVLKDVYGLSCEEIGQELGVSEGAVKVRLHRARRRLKMILERAEARHEAEARDEV
ncbi:MAG TPA: sigma-70 family RNA polymerase sigma factor [Actinomycetota bacterium]|nr:sigma-70 family RNA polymerase sigma factor [Actinomycetota bacterium]